MNISVRIAGRLLKSAVVFLMQTCLLIVPNAKARTLAGYYPNSMRRLLAHHLLRVPPGTPVAAVAAVVRAVPVTTNLIKQGVVYEERFYLHC
jgi:hypothetical protein